MRKTVALTGVIAAIAAAPQLASAQALVPTSNTPTGLSGGGLGHVATVLTIHSNTSAESGCVGTACSGYGGDIQSSQSQLQPISTASGFTGSNFGAFVNINQTNANPDIFMNSFTAYFYGSDQSSLLFSAMVTDQSLTHIDQGVGGYGYLYQLDGAGQAALDAALANGTVYVGAGLDFTGNNDGAETVSIGTFSSQPTTTPEPSSMALLGTGLFGLVPMIRRKIRK